MGSKIEWTEETWNPIKGCTKVSAGCKHCYAEPMAKRLQAMGVEGYEDGFTPGLVPSRLDKPLGFKRPKVFFVASMSDLFHADIPDWYVDKIMDVIRATPQHTYQLLTKRAGRMQEYFSTRSVPDNAWIGVSVENREHGLPRIDHLRQIEAEVRYLSVEPLLEDLGAIDLDGIHWVIAGGESGKGARPMRREWVASVRDQCLQAGTAFFFKQWGAYNQDGNKGNKKRNGNLLDGRVWEEYPATWGN